MRRKNWYQQDWLAGLVALLCIAALLWTGTRVLQYQADSFNQHYGTDFSAWDIFLGAHRQVRVIRQGR